MITIFALLAALTFLLALLGVHVGFSLLTLGLLFLALHALIAIPLMPWRNQ